MLLSENGDGNDVDFTVLKVGSPCGDRLVVKCLQCGRPGVRRGGSLRVDHVIHWRKERSGKERISSKRGLSCSRGVEREVVKDPSIGMPWAPR